MSIDPEHIEAVAASLAPKPLDYYKGTDALRSYTLRAERILTSTDPAVHAALLAALVRAGVLTGETRSADVRWKPREGIQHRYVTRWEETCD